MYDYPDGRLAAPVIADVDHADLTPTDMQLGADVYFWGLRLEGAEADSVILWRPASSADDDAELEAASSFRVSLGEGEAYETPLFPANQRPAVVRVRASAGSARVELRRVVRQ